METVSKINLKIGEIEIKIEGSSEFVTQQYDKIHSNLKSFTDLSKEVKNVKQPKKQKVAVKPEKIEQETEEISLALKSSDLPESFGEWLNKIPKGVSDTEKALLAGYFNQNNNDSKIFKVRDVTKLLKDHGIKLSNPSNLISLATKGKKYIFQFSKDGKQVNFRFSREGETHMKSLLNGTKSE